MMLALVNCRMVTEDAVVPDAVILISAPHIRECGPAARIVIPENCRRIDIGGDLVGPGFIDLHCHGGGGVWWHQDPETFAAAHLRHGTTGLLATSGMYRDLDELCTGLDLVRTAMRSGRVTNLLGVQMEGPYKNPRYGAQPKLSIQVKQEEYRRILDHGADIIRIWTVAPELEGIDPFIAEVSALGHLLSVGHSEAEPEQILGHVAEGLVLACHAFDATGTSPGLKGEAGTRDVSVDDVVLLEDRITAEVIPDSRGIHVRPALLQLIHKVKGPDRVAVITDGTAGSGIMGLKSHEPDVNYNENGLCGSFLTMDRAARNMMTHTGAALPHIFRMASLTPARVLRRDHAVGRIRPWHYADLVVVDDRLTVKRVFLRGKEVGQSGAGVSV